MSFPFPWQFGLPENNTEIEFDADNDKNMDVKRYKDSILVSIVIPPRGLHFQDCFRLLYIRW